MSLRKPSSTLLLLRLFTSRHASTSTPNSRYPFPRHPHPTPHQIFHLPHGASQQDIKARYYDLVKLYHPDVSCDAPAQTRHAQFQAVKHAYDVLRGKAVSHAHLRPASRTADEWNDRVYEELERRRRGGASPSPRSPPEVNVEGWNDKWKDNLLVTFGVVALGIVLFQTIFFVSSAPEQIASRHRSAASNLAQARAEAREFGAQRRAEIRKRVEEQRRDQERLEGEGEDSEIH
ncbi:hypothetical protein BDY19DRAFT_991102 [Irpex rosettiformis]|uniref:Uncharacterized protein n=1 Tax=Irpex rosettiformis TaxID=378272 RepID=A0ACB8UB11_9APHY|nr:hypothetical protein BDY19DRAFT_991102 [Irpex rosettiformis]